MTRPENDPRRQARLDALRRLDELRREEAAIRAEFPELFAPRPIRHARTTMSPAMRSAVSERMKQYWAARRKASGG